MQLWIMDIGPQLFWNNTLKKVIETNFLQKDDFSFQKYLCFTGKPQTNKYFFAPTKRQIH